jgi:hypothetical protein
MNPEVQVTVRLIVLTVVVTVCSYAGIVELGPGSFTPAAPVIDFSTPALGTVNPTYSFTAVPGLGNVSVSFAGAFMGQTVTGTFPKTLSGNPSNALALDTSVETTIVDDGAAGATSPVLSGSPTFNGPIVILFNVDVAAVGLKGGFFDALNGTSITAFDATGASLGTVTNTATGFQFFGLQESTGANVIRGIAFYMTGAEPAGVEIDNVTFGSSQQLAVVPEPATFLSFAAGLLAVSALRYRRNRA